MANNNRKEFKAINNPALACRYWKTHIRHLIALNDILNAFAMEIDALCNRKAILDPIVVKRMLKAMNKKRAKVVNGMKIGKVTLNKF